MENNSANVVPDAAVAAVAVAALPEPAGPATIPGTMGHVPVSGKPSHGFQWFRGSSAGKRPLAEVRDL